MPPIRLARSIVSENPSGHNRSVSVQALSRAPSPANHSRSLAVTGRARPAGTGKRVFVCEQEVARPAGGTQDSVESAGTLHITGLRDVKPANTLFQPEIGIAA